MIKHNIVTNKPRRIHKREVKIHRDEASDIRRLLSLENLEGLSDSQMQRLGCKRDFRRLVFSVDFDDRSSLDWWLCSGTINYYDDVVFRRPFADYCESLDCTYKFDDMEIDTGEDVYIVKLVIV